MIPGVIEGTGKTAGSPVSGSVSGKTTGVSRDTMER